MLFILNSKLKMTCTSSVPFAYLQQLCGHPSLLPLYQHEPFNMQLP